MKTIRHLTTLLGFASLFLFSPDLMAKDIKLEDLVPKETEFGMGESMPEAWQMQKGPGIIDTKPYGGVTSEHWPEARKIVKSYAKNFSLPEGQKYSSKMEDVFAVGGETMTGVGLWLRNVCSYHWIEYDIPADAKKFEGEVFSTDDVRGICFHPDPPMNRLFYVKVFVDGKEIQQLSVNEMSIMDGSGKSIGSFLIDIPKGAKKIRFHAESMPSDNNVNNEVVIHGGKFIIP